MSDEINDVQLEAPTVPELTGIEKQAFEMGWRPEDQYKGDPDKWVDASIFVARAPMFEELKRMNKALKTATTKLNAMEIHSARLREEGYKQAMNELKQLKQAALDDANSSAVIDIDERILELREKQHKERTESQQVDADEANRYFYEFKRSNPWYDQDQDLKEEADAIGQTLFVKMSRSGDVDMESLFIEVAKRVKKLNPDHPAFVNHTKKAAPSVEPGGRGSNVGKKTFGVNDLTEQERRVHAQLFGRGKAPAGFTEEEYFKQCKEMRKA